MPQVNQLGGDVFTQADTLSYTRSVTNYSGNWRHVGGNTQEEEQSPCSTEEVYTAYTLLLNQYG